MAFSIGILADCLKLPLQQAIIKAAQLGASGVQLYATGDELNAALTAKQRRDFKQRVTDAGMRISALCGDFGHGMYTKADGEQYIARATQALQLSCDLGCNIVTAHIGALPESQSNPRYGIMLDACGRLADRANKLGACFAIETGSESSACLKKTLDAIGSKGIGVNFDPANLVMVMGEEPAAAVYTLKDYIVHTHVKDGIQLGPVEPDIIYGFKPWPDGYECPFCEVPLGQGGVDFKRYFSALNDIGYNGFLTIERETGENPAEDIRCAVSFITAQLDALGLK